MLRSIIVDDELKSRETLRMMITSFCQGINVVATCQNVKEGMEAIQTFKPDVIFLDVQMQGETGFDLLSKLEGTKLDVIFTTAHSDYAIRALKSSAIDYLLKPIDIADLQMAVAKVGSKKETHLTERLHQLLQNLKSVRSENYKLALPISDGLIFIRAKDILYCKASGNYTEIFMIDGKKHLVSRQLKEYEDMLDTRDFFRIHHSFLINLNFVKSYVRGEGGHVVMSDNTSIDVSRRKKEAFMDRIGSRG